MFHEGFRVRDVAAGSNHSAAVTSAGELYTWGLGEYGRLGHGDNLTQLTPKRVILCHFYSNVLLEIVIPYSVEFRWMLWLASALFRCRAAVEMPKLLR